MNKTAIVIPARIESSRFPRKMLVDVGGETLIERVFRLCSAKFGKENVFVATDCFQIVNLIGEANSIMTPAEASNGTERIAYAISSEKLAGFDTFVNVQGDMIDPPLGSIEEMVKHLNTGSDVVTLVTEMPKDMQDDPNTVKCIRSASTPHWFARGITGYGDWHLGIYAYNRAALEQYLILPATIPEGIESLEQLRWFSYSGIKMTIIDTEEKCGEINTLEDLNKWQLTTPNSVKR
jgi:3-deoxy-manno-octulosonate cytidylyltransferase (CMP-KDO synthetase)